MEVQVDSTAECPQQSMQALKIPKISQDREIGRERGHRSPRSVSWYVHSYHLYWNMLTGTKTPPSTHILLTDREKLTDKPPGIVFLYKAIIYFLAALALFQGKKSIPNDCMCEYDVLMTSLVLLQLY